MDDIKDGKLCSMNIEYSKHLPLKHLNNSLQEILGQLAGFLSQLSSGRENGSITSPVSSLTVNITIIAPTASGGGATVNLKV